MPRFVQRWQGRASNHVIEDGEDRSKMNVRPRRTIVTSQMGSLAVDASPCGFLLLSTVPVPSRVANGTCASGRWWIYIRGCVLTSSLS